MHDDFTPHADELLEAIHLAYDDSTYPSEFLSHYDIMECLGEGNGCDTFLVQDGQGIPYVAKCYNRGVWELDSHDDMLTTLDHPGLPKHVASYTNEHMTAMVRTFVPGVSLDRHARTRNLSEQNIVSLCVKLCDVLAYLHHRPQPIIHRDIKPANIIVRPDGGVSLIDFDIARVYREGSDADTRFFGTVAYAPPEQYGFSQTDCRADIYALGVVLRFLLTGSPRENRNVRVYRPLEKIIARCTAFDPNRRYADVDQVRRALLRANPRSQGLRIAGVGVATCLACALFVFVGVQVWRAATWSPFNDDAIPAVLNDEERIADAVAYMQATHGTHLFDGSSEIATMGLLRQALVEVYGLDRDYAYGYQTEGLPTESDEYFMAWGLDDDQYLRRDVAVYAAVKVHDPTLVAEDQWSKLSDDNGEYPGSRVAQLFADEHGITVGANRPYDITVGELALLFANADRVFGQQ